jgi:hypothetical protein
MPVSPHSGSSPQESQGSEIEITNAPEALSQAETVKNSQIGRTAFSHRDYPSTAAAIAWYTEGTSLYVTYYQIINDNINRSALTDITALRDGIDIPLMQISDFVLKVSDAFALSWNEEENAGSVTGEAVTVPGFEPKLGEGFVTALTGGSLGFFVVTSITPMSYANERVHRIGFKLIDYFAGDLQTRVNDRVKKTAKAVADTASMRHVFLDSTSYSQASVLESAHDHLVAHYSQLFFSQTVGSFVRPDGVYDPYVVEFMRSIANFPRHTDPSQVYPLVHLTYEKTFWHRILDSKNRYAGTLSSRYSEILYDRRVYDADFNALQNHQYLTIQAAHDNTADEDLPDDVEGYYALSEGFYKGIITGEGAMSALELLVYNGIRSRSVADIASFITTYIDPVYDLSTDDKFYQIPLILWLSRLARRSIQPLRV